MLKAFINCFKIKELRFRILFTLGLIALVRLMAYVPCPGIDPKALAQVFEHLGTSQGSGGLVGMLNLFTGGALMKFAVGALGIMPYITASIIMSLLTPVLPQLEKLKREGESGFQRINQYTRYLTLAVCVVQGWMTAATMLNPSFLDIQEGLQVVTLPGPLFKPMTVIILTCGTMVIMWMGELITDKGIGNGASLIITVGIVEGIPTAVFQLWDLFRQGSTGDASFTLIHLCILVALFVLVTAGTVALSVGVRKIPIQYARTRASRIGGAAPATFFPLRVNFANVMPIIFASSLLMFPPILIKYLYRLTPKVSYIAGYFNYGTTSYMVLYALLIILFSFFWVANQFNPLQISDDLKKNGAYIPGVRPGKPTADFLDWSMTRVTTAGAIFLTVIALLPMIFSEMLNVPPNVAHFFGGTSQLITVGVLLDTVRQMESHLLMHGGYEGFLRHGRVRATRRMR